MLWEISSSGSNLRQLLPCWRTESWLCCGHWTPDGRFFIFLSGDTLLRSTPHLPGTQLWAIDERRRLFRRRPAQPIRLTPGPTRWGAPIPARDGKAVAYASFPDGILWRANRDGSGLIQLSDPPMYPKLLHWSPTAPRSCSRASRRKATLPCTSFLPKVAAPGGFSPERTGNKRMPTGHPMDGVSFPRRAERKVCVLTLSFVSSPSPATASRLSRIGGHMVSTLVSRRSLHRWDGFSFRRTESLRLGDAAMVGAVQGGPSIFPLGRTTANLSTSCARVVIRVCFVFPPRVVRQSALSI